MRIVCYYVIMFYQSSWKIYLSTAHVAFCGELFELKFTLPFVEFLPETVQLNFAILVRTLCNFFSYCIIPSSEVGGSNAAAITLSDMATQIPNIKQWLFGDQFIIIVLLLEER